MRFIIISQSGRKLRREKDVMRAFLIFRRISLVADSHTVKKLGTNITITLSPRGIGLLGDWQELMKQFAPGTNLAQKTHQSIGSLIR